MDQPPPRKHPDPYVAFFLNADPEPAALLAAVQTLPGPLPLKFEAIRKLLKVSLGQLKLDRDLSRLIERAYREPSGVDLQILLLLAWIRALLLVGPHWSKMRVLGDQTTSLISEHTPPEILAWASLSDVVLELHAGATVAGLQRLTRAVARLPTSSLHRKRLELIRVLHFLQHGMGAAVDVPDQLKDAEPDSISATRLRAMQVVDAALTGACDSVGDMGPIAMQPGVIFFPRDYQVARQAIALMREQRGHTDPESPKSKSGAEDDPHWVISSRYLMRGDPDQALHWARKLVSEGGPHTTVGLDAYALIRAELALKRGEAATRLLTARRDRGSWHYMDDFFIARADLLLGKPGRAAAHWSRLMQAIRDFRAEARLDFEVALACELKPSAVAKLSIDSSRAGAPGVATQPDALEARPTPSLRGTDRLVGRSIELAAIRDRVLTFAEHDAPVLITGETGTGKELVALALHEASRRRGEPFVAINCGALSDTLVESELFGYRRGAFTGAQAAHQGVFREAKRGTLFLDEIGDIPQKLQRALLRVLETREVRPVGSSKRYGVECRVVAATNAKLEQRVREGAFRQDLFYRLHRLSLHLPPLRERPDDILELAFHFFNLDRSPGQRVEVTRGLRERLRAQPWPGNVRELRNAVERMRVLNSDKLSYDTPDFEIVVVADGTTEEPAPTLTAAPSGESLQPEQGSRAKQALSAQPDSRATAPPPRAGEPLDPHPSLQNNQDVAGFLLQQRSSLRRLMRLRELFDEFHALKTSEVARILGVSRHTARRDLTRLCEEGLVEKVEPTRSPNSHFYRLSTRA